MEAYGGKQEDDVDVKVEEFDPRMYYQQNCVKDFPTHSQQQNCIPIKLTKPRQASEKDQPNSTTYARIVASETERNNNFGNTSNSSFLVKKESSSHPSGSESALGIPNDVYPEDTCAHCGKIFPGPISVRTHQIVHRLVPPKTKICCCGERFHLRSGLENHMRICRTTEILKQQQQELAASTAASSHNNSTYFTRETKPTVTVSVPQPQQPPPPPSAPPKQNLISIVTNCPNCGNGAVALADIHAEPITFHCSQCSQEIKNVMFVRILQDGQTDANSLGRDSAGITLPIKQEVSYIISDGTLVRLFGRIRNVYVCTNVGTDSSQS